MMSGLGPAAVLLAGAAGLLAILALWQMIGASPAIADWLGNSLEPLRRARREGYLPSSGERLRLALLGVLAAIVGGWYLAGPVAALLLAAAAPLTAGYTLRLSRRRYRRSVERALPDVARAIADSLSAGHSPRGALAAAATSLEGPAATEFSRVRYGLDLGHPTVEAITALADRFRSERVDAFATALVSQRTAGGDLAALLRRFADGAAERDRVAEDARSATVQARFTGYLVVAMPVAGALFTEFIQPGFIGSLFGSQASVVLVGLAVALQGAGFLLISKMAKIGEP